MRASLLVLVCLGGVAAAEPAPTFAIDLRSRDALADKITDTLETALREVGAGSGARYRAKGTRKDRVAASTDDCPNALVLRCAADIGERLGVDYVFAGEVQTRGTRFLLTLDIVNVSTKTRVRSLRDLVPTTTTAKVWSKQVFARITDKVTGSLTIACNVPRAVVLIDGQQATELFQHTGMVSGLALGRHAVELRADHYKSYASEVNIDGAEQLNVLLVAEEPR